MSSTTQPSKQIESRTMGLVYHLLLLSFLIHSSLSADTYIGQFCSQSFESHEIHANIDRVLSDLVAVASVGGFATSSSGKGNTTIHGLAQCRGDVGSTDCSTCLNAAAKKLPAACPNQADARVWYDYCFVRYSTEDFIGSVDTGYALILINTQSETADPKGFDAMVGKVMGQARAEAVGPGSGGLGRGRSNFTPFVTIYGLAQCTRDLEPMSCGQCLASAVEKLPEYCRYRKGCQIHYSSCMARYEVYPFYYPLEASQSPVGRYSKVILHP